MPLHVYKDIDSFNHAVASWIADQVSETLKKQERFTFVLSGGNTPKAIYQLLATSPYKERIAWEKLHIFWGDERAVPFDDSRNNAKMAYETLLDHVPVVPDQIHTMRTDISPEESAEAYEKILRQYFPLTSYLSSKTNVEEDPSPLPTFDLVLLGMGEDGHTLSLFPGTSVIQEEKKWVSAYFLQAQDMDRITLTKAVVNKSSLIVFLATGANKSNALKEVLEGKYDPFQYPSQVIKTEKGSIHWFVDKAAASQLTDSSAEK